MKKRKWYLAFARFLVISQFVYLLISPSELEAQYRIYEFNSPGSECYFRYACFAADSDYVSIKRPFLFILGREGESSEDIFRRDTLHNLPQFAGYKFFFVPAAGNNPAKKLQCLPALSSLLTNTFRYGHTNIFLNVDDRDISQEDLNKNMLYNIFSKIHLAQNDTVAETSAGATENITSTFTEQQVQYDPVVKEETATFYVEKDNKNDTGSEAESEKLPVKTFFGPAENFNFTLTGKVVDKVTGEALPFSSIQVKGTIIGTTTNSDGFFTLVKVPTDTSTLVIQYVGYRASEVFLTPSVQMTDMKVELSPSIQALKGVTITASKDEVVMTKKESVNTVKITPKKLEQLPSMGERDVMRSFQLMPGISASNESSSGLYVRGGTPDQNLVLYDGFTVYHVDHLYGFYSAFNSNALKDVQLYKGGFESKFGGRLSSVTEITSKEGNQKRFNTGGDLSLLSANVYAEGPIGKNMTAFLAFRRSYQGPIYDLISDKFGKGSVTRASAPVGEGRRFEQAATITSYFYDLNGKLTWHPDNNNIISLSIYNGTDKLDNGFDAAEVGFGQRNANFNMNSADLTKYGNIGASLKWSRKWNPNIYGNTVLSYSNYYSNRDRSQERTIYSEDKSPVTTRSGIFENNDLKDFSLRSDYQWDMFNFSKFQFGVFATLYDVKYDYAQSDTLKLLDRSDNGPLTGGYVQNEFRIFKDRIRILPGIRFSYYDITGGLYAEPRLSGSFAVTDRLSIKAASGKYYQFANRITREDIMSGSKDFWILSDGESIPVSSSIHFTAGLSYETPVWLFSSELYYKEIANLTEYSLRINASPMGTDYNENFFAGEAYSRGVEFLAQKKYGDLTGWVSYTLGEAMNYFNMYSVDYFPANQDVRHEFKIVGMYNFRRFVFSANWIYASGRPYTAPSGAYTIDLLGGSSQDFFTVTSKNYLRLPDYHRLDLSVTYKLLRGWKSEKRRKEIGYVGFSLFNIYNHLNTWYKQYTIVDGQVLETNINYLGITPNLTLSLKLR